MSAPTPPAGLSESETAAYLAGFEAGAGRMSREARRDEWHRAAAEPDDEDWAPAGPKYPHVDFQLSRADGNGFVMASQCRVAMKRAGVPADECQAFFDEALSGNYDHVIQTIMATVQTS